MMSPISTLGAIPSVAIHRSSAVHERFDSVYNDFKQSSTVRLAFDRVIICDANVDRHQTCREVRWYWDR